MKHAILSRCTQGAFRYQAWPTVTKTEEGILLVGTSGHRLDHICPFGKDLMYESRDEGETWSAPQIINDTYLDDRDAGMLAWGKGKLLLTWFNHAPEKFKDWDPLADTRPHYAVANPLSLGMRALWDTLPKEAIPSGSFTKISYDNGKTWSAPRQAPVTSPHGPCLLADGSLFWVGNLNRSMENPKNPSCPSEQAEKKSGAVQDMDGGSTAGGNRIFAYRSTDDGESWTRLSHVPCPEGAEGYCCEPNATLLHDGTILAAVRYHCGAGHGNRKMYTVKSSDGGKTWGEAKFLDVWGAPPHVLQHSSGAVVLVYGKRRDEMGQYAIVSTDGGCTWSEEKRISPIAPDWDQGYPSSVELSGGDIFTVYYQKCPGDSFNSLHSVRWNLRELL
ncbi:MAG: exo-alpha-sialidase [Clostridia bacterium]|nr:exo-alpha-sialidase [Clostridia bacterium]